MGPRFAVLFPGQGSQAKGMADVWLEHPAGLSVLDRSSVVLGRDVVAGCHDEAAMATTAFVQPALLACGVAAWDVLLAEGLRDVAGVAGHSLGEFAALVACGALSLPDALALVIVRGEAMQRAGEDHPGAMTALLALGTEDAEALCDEVRGADVLVVANENSPAQVVASGDVAAIERLEALAKERKTRAIRLQVAGAFHSELMRQAVQPVLDALADTEVRDPSFPIAVNVTGAFVSDGTRLRELIGCQVVSPVRWETSVRTLAAAGASRFLEAGTGDVLTRLMKRIVPEAEASAVGSPEMAAAAVNGR
ncbi:MAG: ACP S-malonyltransferase [Actinomycetota bacterium]